jgi:hypothetical protein
MKLYHRILSTARRTGSRCRPIRWTGGLVGRLSESVTKFLDNPIRWKPRLPSDAEADDALTRVQRAVFGRLHEFVEAKLLRVPRPQWTAAFYYRGRGSTSDRARVIQTIYESSAPIPGPALDTRSEQFLPEVRVLVHEAVGEGGGELVSDVLGQAADSGAKQPVIPIHSSH